MEISNISIASLIIFAPSMFYNLMGVLSITIDHLDNKWEANKSEFYPVLLFFIVLSVIILLTGFTIFFAMKLTPFTDVSVVAASLSVLLSFYVSYYHRFSKNLWTLRFFYS